MRKKEDKVRRFVAEGNLLGPTDKVLVALSGGADSVCLLLVLKELGYVCVAAHCNFHLRGEESMRDEAFVREFCTRHGVELHVVDFDTKAYAREQHVSIELAARNLRYDYFLSLMQAVGCTRLAVGHHKDDNAETFLLNAVRKAGVRGLCGIRPLAVNSQGTTVVRPLLCLCREEVEAYLRERGESWVVDSTNLQDEAARNKIRHNVIPALKAINPAAVDNLCQTMANLTEVMRVYSQEMKCCIEQCTNYEGDTLHIDRKRLAACTSPISVLHEILAPMGFNETQIRNLLTARGYRSNRPKGGKAIKLPGHGVVNVAVSWEEIVISQ